MVRILWVLMVVGLVLNVEPITAMAQVGDDTSAGTVTFIELEHDGYTYSVRLFLPSLLADTEDQAFPLIIALHGAGYDGESTARVTQFDTYGEEAGVIVAYPTSQFGYWDYGYGLPEWEGIKALDDVGFIEALYQTLLEDYPVDKTQVYMVGYSNGSRMVLRMACQHADWLAGAAVVAAGMSTEIAATCSNVSQVKLFYQHGTDDSTVPWEGKPLRDGGRVVSIAFSAPDTATFWALQNGCTTEPTITDMPDENPDDSVIVRQVLFDDCTSGKSVIFYAVIGGGHGWLGAPINLETDFKFSGNTSDYIFGFFGLQSKAG